MTDGLISSPDDIGEFPAVDTGTAHIARVYDYWLGRHVVLMHTLARATTPYRPGVPVTGQPKSHVRTTDLGHPNRPKS
jgi:hypothetical protein